MYDDRFYKSKAYRLSILTGVLQSCCELSLWCFGEDGELCFSSNIYAKELEKLFEISGCKAYAMTEGTKYDAPFVMSDSIGLIWVGEYAVITEKRERLFILMGPVFVSKTSAKVVEYRLKELEIKLSLKRMCRTALRSVPVVHMSMLYSYIKILHFLATENILRIEDIVHQTDALKKTDDEIIQKERHFIDYENAYECEQIILQCIREGNLHYDQILESIILSAKPDNYLTGDPLREAKNTLIILVSACCRAAIESKLSIRTAKNIEVRYIRRIEQCTMVTEVINLCSAAITEFVNHVHELKNSEGISQSVRDCCDYVQAHFMEKIELADIAKSVCYTEYYLTRKFRQEMGISLKDYIRDIRIKYAKIQLISTEDSIQKISEKMQFGTRNYFTRVFQEYEGGTPTQYRKKVRNV